MHPLLDLPILDTSVRTHRTLLLAAILVANWIAYRAAVRDGLNGRRVALALLATPFLTVFGGRLHYVIAQWPRFESNPWQALLPTSIHAPGAVLLGLLGTPLVLRALRIPIGRFVDCLAPAAGVGIALARLGCFMQSCCFGRPSSLPWAIQFPKTSYIYLHHRELGLVPPDSAPLPVHPLQLYFAAAALCITLFLLWLRPRRRFEGELGLVFLVLFFASSAALEPLRADTPSRVYLGAEPQLLWVSAFLGVICLVALLFRHFQERTSSSGLAASG